MAFPDSTWPCGCDEWYVDISSPEVVTVDWTVESFLRECQEERKELRSYDFGFAGATWNFFTSLDGKEVHSLFGINVKPLRFSDAVLDCYCYIKFEDTSDQVIKKIECKFKCENANSHWLVENFLSNSELEKVLKGGHEIICRITVKKSSIKEARPFAGVIQSSSSSTAHTETQLFPNYPVAFPDSNWPCCGDSWSVHSDSSEQVNVYWYIGNFLRECQEERKGLRSYDFGFAGATWNLFTSFHGEKAHSLFGINVKPHRLSEAVFDCDCEIEFYDYTYTPEKIKTIGCRFKCGSSDSYYAMQHFLSNSEHEKFLQWGHFIKCIITDKKWITKEACTPAEITHSSSSGAVDAHALIQMLPSKDEEISKIHSIYKVCHDLKQMLSSEEGSDVTLQVRDHQFKAHRSILMARSSVFAAILRHDTKEKATGVVDVEDCDPSSFPVLLEFIYTGCTEKLSVENVFNLYKAADEYDVEELKLECLEFMKNNLSVETFCETVRFSLMHPETSLLKLAIDFFARSMKKVIVTANWQSFLLENPIQGNEILIKALGADSLAD